MGGMIWVGHAVDVWQSGSEAHNVLARWPVPCCWWEFDAPTPPAHKAGLGNSMGVHGMRGASIGGMAKQQSACEHCPLREQVEPSLHKTDQGGSFGKNGRVQHDQRCQIG